MYDWIEKAVNVKSVGTLEEKNYQDAPNFGIFLKQEFILHNFPGRTQILIF